MSKGKTTVRMIVGRRRVRAPASAQVHPPGRLDAATSIPFEHDAPSGFPGNGTRMGTKSALIGARIGHPQACLRRSARLFRNREAA